MKTAGWILIALGIIMIIIKGVSIPEKKTIIDAGPIQVNKTENHWYGWPTYAGGVLAIVGIVMVASSKKNSLTFKICNIKNARGNHGHFY
ncbi:MAG: hypothetical protein ACTHOB_17535 [Ginsengibacter sp.]